MLDKTSANLSGHLVVVLSRKKKKNFWCLIYHAMTLHICLQIEAGLGLSESFYHVAISAFSIGEFLGAMTASIISGRVSLWYNTMAGLLCYITGFVVYATATSGWMIVLARILSGAYVGLQTVILLAYFGMSYQHYLEVLGPEERTKEEGKTTRVKDTLFALYCTAGNMGALIGPGLITACMWCVTSENFILYNWFVRFQCHNSDLSI